MNILLVMNGIGSVNGMPGVSGGDVRAIEIAKNWQLAGHQIQVYTSLAGVNLCKKMGLNSTFHVFQVPNSYSLKNYIVRFLKSWILPKTLDDFKGIIYSTSEHIYDVIPAFRIKKKNKENIWAAVVHFVAPFHRTGNNNINNILFYANQRLGFNYIKNKADLVLAVSRNTARQIENIGIKDNVYPVFAGVDFKRITEVVSQSPISEYDAIFMKRFNGTKGVFDMLEIWKEVTKVREDAKLGMIGQGTEDIMIKLRGLVNSYHLEKKVDFLGPIYDFSQKFLLLASSKLFTLPSYEENWGIVIGEAMAAGIPVLCYDLPEIRSLWKNNVEWVPKGNKKLFATKILKLLNNHQKREKLSQSGIDFIKKYDWYDIAEKEMNIMLALNKSEL